MPLYVLALLDRAPRARIGYGLSSPVTVRRVPGGYAAVERRADVPPLEFGPLQAHERTVARLADSVPAILPVRFGTLLEADELTEALEGREEELAQAFALVRHRMQFTWRATRRRVPRGTTARTGRRTARSGTEYLRRAARAAQPAPSPAFRSVKPLGALAVQERFAPATERLPAALYHLVDRSRMKAYQAAADAIRPSAPGLTLSGPFPPYAFAPELL